MCRHNDEDDYLCDDCCYDVGYMDAIVEEPYSPSYKNFSQCNAYGDGYAQGLLFLLGDRSASEKVAQSCECGSCENTSHSGS